MKKNLVVELVCVYILEYHGGMMKMSTTEVVKVNKS